MCNGRLVTTFLSAGLLAALLPLARSGDPLSVSLFAAEHPQLVVHVADYAHVAAQDLRATQGAVAHAFTRIGVDIDWRFDNGEREPASQARHITVVLMNDTMQAIRVARGAVQPTTLGTAAAAASRIYVFFPRVVGVAIEERVPVASPLSQVIVHELGHILLRNGHGDFGIMRHQLPKQGIISFDQFTAADGVRIRAALEPVVPPRKADRVLAAR